MWEFAKYYIKSMRLYYGFVTLTAGAVGMALYQGQFSALVCILSLLILFCSWGVNQIINDYMGMKEDAINAPLRPMVCGKLNPKMALSVSSIFLLFALFFIIFIRPLACIPLIVGVLLNILYSYAKGYGILGNLVFGLMIPCCTLFGFLILGGTTEQFFTKHVAIWVSLVLLNMLMTNFTYFKDCEGDKKAHKETLVVRYGHQKVGLFSFIVSILTLFIPIFFLKQSNVLYLLSAFIGSVLFIWTGYLYWKAPLGDKTYHNLKYNFAALSVMQASFVCLNYPLLGCLLSTISLFGVLYIFQRWHYNANE